MSLTKQLQLRAARFPIHRDLSSFDWQETPLDHAQIQQLASSAFMDSAQGFTAIHQDKRIRFYIAVDLVNQLEREKQQSKASNLAKQLLHIDAMIIDELGYLTFPDSGGVLLLFHPISQLYQKSPLILTTILNVALI